MYKILEEFVDCTDYMAIIYVILIYNPDTSMVLYAYARNNESVNIFETLEAMYKHEYMLDTEEDYARDEMSYQQFKDPAYFINYINETYFN